MERIAVSPKYKTKCIQDYWCLGIAHNYILFNLTYNISM